MTLYSVRNWRDKYENNRTRELKRLDWVPVPNKQDGDGYTELVGMQDGAGLLGCWLAVLQIASKCDPRGQLMRENGEPHTAQSLGRMSHLPAALMARALEALVIVGWLESVPYENPAQSRTLLRENAVSSVPFPSIPFSEERGSGGKGFPANAEDAAAQCALVAVPKEFVMHCYDKGASRGGLDAKEREIRDFPAYVRTQWKYEQDRKGKEAANGQPAQQQQTGADKVILGRELERVIEKMRAIRSTYGDHQTWNYSDQDEWAKLKKRKAELKAILGVKI